MKYCSFKYLNTGCSEWYVLVWRIENYFLFWSKDQTDWSPAKHSSNSWSWAYKQIHKCHIICAFLCLFSGNCNCCNSGLCSGEFLQYRSFSFEVLPMYYYACTSCQTKWGQAIFSLKKLVIPTRNCPLKSLISFDFL